LSDHLAAQLTDPTSALAAAFIIANRHPAILQWAARMIGAAPPPSSGNGAKRPKWALTQDIVAANPAEGLASYSRSAPRTRVLDENDD
jgi:hypothetical protein